MERMNDDIWQRAKFLAQHSERSELRSITLLIMYDLGIPVNYSGFDYLKHVIPLAVNRSSQIVVRELFEEVGTYYTPVVEYWAMDSSVRDALKMAWNARDLYKWSCYFPDYMLRRKKSPSNLEFITAVAYFLEMWQGCCKEGEYVG